MTSLPRFSPSEALGGVPAEPARGVVLGRFCSILAAMPLRSSDAFGGPTPETFVANAAAD